MPKQLQIPGTERDSNPEIDAAAGALLNLQNSRYNLLQQEETAREELRAVMRKHKKKSYLYVSEDLGEDGKAKRYDVSVEASEPKATIRKHKDPRPKAEEAEANDD